MTANDSRLGPVTQYALLAGPLLSMVDSSIVNVAVDPIAQELRAPLTTVQWTVSGYLLAMGAGLAATSYPARRFGTLPLYRASLVAFTVASAACALAPNAEALLAARAMQGLVGAPMVPLAMSMMLRGGDATRSMSPLAGILLFLGPALGPSVGGGLIGVAGWRSIFLVNVPIGAVAALFAARMPALGPGRDTHARFDLPGLLLLAVGLTSLLYGADQGGQHGWSTSAAWTPLTVGAVLLICYAFWSSRRDHPALDLSTARAFGSVLALLLCGAASVVTYAAVFLLPVFVQSVQGHSALAAGMAMLPQGVITGVATALGSRLLARVSVRSTVLSGFAVLTVASSGLLEIGVHTPLAIIASILAARSAAIGLVITPLLTMFLRPLQAARFADANTLFSIWQRIAGLLRHRPDRRAVRLPIPAPGSRHGASPHRDRSRHARGRRHTRLRTSARDPEHLTRARHRRQRHLTSSRLGISGLRGSSWTGRCGSQGRGEPRPRGRAGGPQGRAHAGRRGGPGRRSRRAPC